MAKFKKGQLVMWISDLSRGNTTVRNARFPSIILKRRGDRYRITPDCGDPDCSKNDACLYAPGELDWAYEWELDALTPEEAAMTTGERTDALEALGRTPDDAAVRRVVDYIMRTAGDEDRQPQLDFLFNQVQPKAVASQSAEPVEIYLRLLRWKAE